MSENPEFGKNANCAN